LYRKWTLESLENHEYELKHVETFKSTPMVQELKQQDISNSVPSLMDERVDLREA
jgi:hypothetical protein